MEQIEVAFQKAEQHLCILECPDGVLGKVGRYQNILHYVINCGHKFIIHKKIRNDKYHLHYLWH